MRRKESKKAHNKRKNKDQQSNGKCSEYVECRAYSWLGSIGNLLDWLRMTAHSFSQIDGTFTLTITGRTFMCMCMFKNNWNTSHTIFMISIPIVSNAHFEQFYLYNGKITKKVWSRTREGVKQRNSQYCLIAIKQFQMEIEHSQ